MRLLIFDTETTGLPKSRQPSSKGPNNWPHIVSISWVILDADTNKSIVRETVEEVLSENGLLTESTSKSNEVFSFKVGNHRFEGKVTKIVKIK